MRRLILPLLIVAIVGLALSVVGLVTLMRRNQRTEDSAPRVLQPDPVAVGLSVPDFALTDQDGRPQTQTALDDHVTIIDFIFTHCPFACPMMTSEMKGLADGLAGTPVRFASFSVDPAHDTPERLKQYATDLGVDPSRWTFLTGEPGAVEKIVRGSLQFALQADPTRTVPLGSGATMQNITHPTKLILVGPDRKVLGFYNPNQEDEMALLKARAKAAAEVVAARK